MKLKNTPKSNYFDDYKINVFQRLIYGLAMGISDGIPGYSGGTTLSILDFFNKLVFKLKLFFNFKVGIKNWFKNILWLVPFLLFWILALFSFSYFGKAMSSNGFSVALILLFFFFSIFSIPLFWKANKKEINNPLLNKKKVKNKNFVFIFLGFLLILILGVLVYLRGGILINSSSSITKINFSIQWLWICLSAILAGFCMLIPGVSGSFAIFLTNTYGDIYFIVLQNISDNFLLLFLILISILIGIFLSIFLSSYLLKNYKTFFINFCAGMVCASPLAIILGMFGNSVYKNNFIESFLSHNIEFGLIIIFFLLAILISTIINIHIKKCQQNQFEFKKGDALFVIDMQNDFDNKTGVIKIKKFKKIARKINLLFHEEHNKFLKIIASKDSHPIDHISFTKWGQHCLENSKGAEITKLINIPFDLILTKGINKTLENYSCFYNGNKKNNDLFKFLKKNEIKRIFVTGVISDFCVKYTILDAQKFGYDVYCIGNLISTNNTNFKINSVIDKSKIIFFYKN